MPSVACKSLAIGVSRLTGMNSEAISMATRRVIEPTAPHACVVEFGGFIVVVFMDARLSARRLGSKPDNAQSAMRNSQECARPAGWARMQAAICRGGAERPGSALRRGRTGGGWGN